MKRWIIALVAVLAVFAATAGAAFAADPVQSATQSSSTDQGALAASSATQIQPSNQNISVRVLSPGDDGAVSQSNEASSNATATNTASTTQNANQTQASGCGCVVKGLESGDVGQILGGALQAAAGTDPAAPATAAPTAAPAPAGSTQSNDASSTGTSTNAAPTTQGATQSSAPAGGGVQSSQQQASTDQTAAAASSATQVQPSNSNISVRVLSPGNDGAVSQSNKATSTANATNTATTTQGSTQTGGGSGVQSSTQNADTTQKAIGLSSATQVKPENSNLSVRVLSPGNGGSVSQSNEATSSANAQNTAPVTQTTSQTGVGSPCGCTTKPGVQSIDQSSTIGQLAGSASSAFQVGASNTNDPVRIGSGGNDGSVNQENEAESTATATNTAPVTQTGTQMQAASGCGCSSGTAVQAIGQKSETGQLAGALSSAKQIGASNESGPIRIGSWGGGGSVSQENEADSSATASNTAPTTQTGTQSQTGSGVQALGQKASTWQAGFALSSATQLPGPSKCSCECGCGASFGNSADPIRIGSPGNDGSVDQENEAESHATATNTAPVVQTGTQTESPSRCGCVTGPAVQAIGQKSETWQLAGALSSAKQIGASNDASPIRIWSWGNGGSVSQENEAKSSATASNNAPTTQTGTQTQSGSGVQALGQKSETWQKAFGLSSATQLPGESTCGCGSSFGNSADGVRIASPGNDGYLNQENEASSNANAPNFAATTQTGTQNQAAPSCGCNPLGVQALGQWATVDQLAAALSAAKQIGAANESGPIRVKSWGGGGSTSQSNEADSGSSAPNDARTLQVGRMFMV